MKHIWHANLANLTRQNVKELLADAISGSLPSWKPLTEISPTVDSLADDEVLALTQLALEPNTDARLILLLISSNLMKSTDAEREELDQLMQQYQEGLYAKRKLYRSVNAACKNHFHHEHTLYFC
ncbi:MAG: hypothetical protein R2867_32430 [Caldilineaceae bacterium]